MSAEPHHRRSQEQPANGTERRALANGGVTDWQPLRPVSFAGFRLSIAGLLFVAVTILLCIAALSTESNLLFLVFGLCAATPIINFVMVWRSMRRLSIRRSAAGTINRGQSFELRYDIRSARWRAPTFALGLSESLKADAVARVAPTSAQRVAPRQPAACSAAGVADRRGLLMLGRVVVESSFPFGFVKRVLAADLPQAIVVYPTVQADTPLHLPRGGAHGLGTSRAALSRQLPDEFIGVREYRHGDNPQWIHWRRSARTGELVVREMASRRARELMLVVDHRSLKPDLDDLDRMVEMAATVGCDALERGFRVGLVAIAAEPVIIAPVAGRRHREKLLYELALLHGMPQSDPNILLSRIRWPASRAAVGVFLTCADDPTADGIESFVRQRSQDTRRLDGRSGIAAAPAARSAARERIA